MPETIEGAGAVGVTPNELDFSALSNPALFKQQQGEEKNTIETLLWSGFVAGLIVTVGLFFTLG
jgi:hypothetical protein